MPTRLRKPTDLPEPEDLATGEEDPIEIIEVVGVDETTGEVKAEMERIRSAPAATNGDRERPVAPPGDPLEEALRDKDKYYDLLLRKQAEFENFRKRVERERGESSAAAARDVLKRLLPVMDNMERAIRTSEGSSDPLYKGIGLVHQQFLDLLRKEGVQPIESVGARFDPRVHEAVEVLDAAGVEANIVLEEMQKGYTYFDKLLRPALVKVASGKAPRRGIQEDAEQGGRREGEES